MDLARGPSTPQAGYVITQQSCQLVRYISMTWLWWAAVQPILRMNQNNERLYSTPLNLFHHFRGKHLPDLHTRALFLSGLRVRGNVMQRQHIIMYFEDSSAATGAGEQGEIARQGQRGGGGAAATTQIRWAAALAAIGQHCVCFKEFKWVGEVYKKSALRTIPIYLAVVSSSTGCSAAATLQQGAAAAAAEGGSSSSSTAATLQQRRQQQQQRGAAAAQQQQDSSSSRAAEAAAVPATVAEHT